VLSVKQKKFADEYIKTGNAYESYITVYKVKTTVAKANSSRLLTNANLIKYIDETNIALTRATIADMTEVKEYWSNILRNDKDGVKGGLKASEYIAKSNAAFIEKVEQSGGINVNIKWDNEHNTE